MFNTNNVCDRVTHGRLFLSPGGKCSFWNWQPGEKNNSLLLLFIYLNLLNKIWLDNQVHVMKVYYRV